jgi:hypothetical protein
MEEVVNNRQLGIWFEHDSAVTRKHFAGSDCRGYDTKLASF